MMGREHTVISNQVERCFGTNAARCAMKSSGLKYTCVVPSRYGVGNDRLVFTRYLAIARLASLRTVLMTLGSRESKSNGYGTLKTDCRNGCAGLQEQSKEFPLIANETRLTVTQANAGPGQKGLVDRRRYPESCRARHTQRICPGSATRRCRGWRS